MTKEEQRFQEVVDAMYSLCFSDIDVIKKDTPRFVNIVKIDKIKDYVGEKKEGIYDIYTCTNCIEYKCGCIIKCFISKNDNYCHNCGSKIEWVIEENEPLPPYEKDLFANSKNGDGKKTHDVIVADTVVTKANPDARVVTKTQITTQNINSI